MKTPLLDSLLNGMNGVHKEKRELELLKKLLNDKCFDYPKQEKREECDNPRCIDGFIAYTHLIKPVKCPTCKGTGEAPIKQKVKKEGN